MRRYALCLFVVLAAGIAGDRPLSARQNPFDDFDRLRYFWPAVALCPDCTSLADEANALLATHNDLGRQIVAAGSDLRRLGRELSEMDRAFQEASRRGNQEAAATLRKALADIVQQRVSLSATLTGLEKQFDDVSARIIAKRKALDECHRTCAPAAPASGTGGALAGRDAATATAAGPAAGALCKECQPRADRVQVQRQRLTELSKKIDEAGQAMRSSGLEGDAQSNDSVSRYFLLLYDRDVAARLLKALERELEACNRKCAGATGTSPAPANSSGHSPGVTLDDSEPAAVCPDCEETAERTKAAQGEHLRIFDRLDRIAQELSVIDEQIRRAPAGSEALRNLEGQRGQIERTQSRTREEEAQKGREVDALINQLNGCNRKCRRPTEDRRTGDSRAPGTEFTLADASAWSAAARGAIDTAVQVKLVDGASLQSPDGSPIVVPPQVPQQAQAWLNPLGLLARPYSGGQAAALPSGLHVLLTDRGGSTGKTLGLQILNFTGQPVRLASTPFTIEPLTQQAQGQVQQAFARLGRVAPVTLDLSAYCLEFLKLPPQPNTIFRLAPSAVQQKYASMSKVLQSAVRVQREGLLRPDSDPAAYGDSITQWAVWAVEQNLNEARFTDAFVGHTRKNLEAAGQKWAKPLEDAVRQMSPNRWRDISSVLQGAGLAASP